MVYLVGSPSHLLQHGLLRASFVPPRPQRELRDLTRYRSSLAADRARLINRIQKTLEDTNIKLASVATDITGKSARAILEAMLAGEQDPTILADLAHKRMQGKREQLIQALQEGGLRSLRKWAIEDVCSQILSQNDVDKQKKSSVKMFFRSFSSRFLSISLSFESV